MNIAEIPVDITLPHRSIGVVMMQPFVDLDINHEPFIWKVNKKNQQLALIEETLALAIGRPANQDVNFTLFPEYSIPGIAGIAAIEKILLSDAWPANTVVIAGVDGLEKAEYATLLDRGAIETVVHEQNKSVLVSQGEWLNTCITWVKSNDGLRRWIQPKLAPAQLENNVVAQRMFRGQGVFVFRGGFDNGTEIRFMTLICYDWIDGHSGLWDVLNAFNAQSTANREINIFFIIQHNPKPNDNLFLEYARRYFEEPNTCPRLNRAGGALVFANTAGRADAGLVTRFGFSSLICGPCRCFDEAGCPPTFAVKTERLRRVPNLRQCREALLRENGACIHTFGLRLPRWIDPNVGDRAHPIENALVHPLASNANEPRTTSDTITAIVKWCSDHLTTIELLLNANPQHPLKAPLDASQQDIVERIRRRTHDSLSTLMNLLSVAISVQESQNPTDKWTNIGSRKIHNVDYWDADDVKSLEFLIYALAILKFSHQIQVTTSTAHGTLRINNELYDVAVVCGPSHDDCERNARERFGRKPPRHVLLITKDLLRGFKRLKVKGQIDDTGDSKPDITDPSSAWHFCDYTDLISTINVATDQATLTGRVNEELAL